MKKEKKHGFTLDLTSVRFGRPKSNVFLSKNSVTWTVIKPSDQDNAS